MNTPEDPTNCSSESQNASSTGRATAEAPSSISCDLWTDFIMDPESGLPVYKSCIAFSSNGTQYPQTLYTNRMTDIFRLTAQYCTRGLQAAEDQVIEEGNMGRLEIAWRAGMIAGTKALCELAKPSLINIGELVKCAEALSLSEEHGRYDSRCPSRRDYGAGFWDIVQRSSVADTTTGGFAQLRHQIRTQETSPIEREYGIYSRETVRELARYPIADARRAMIGSLMEAESDTNWI